jgi:ribosomal protein S18 acetylase RimI-like enzyme
MDVFPLSPSDAAALRTLRLRALRDHPEAFSSSVEEEEKISVAEVTERIRKETPENCTFGVFVNNMLAGIVHVARYTRTKVKHKAHIGGMYIVPEARGRGAGRALLDAAVTHARGLGGVEELVLAVTVGNESARRLYESVGFVRYAIEPHFIRVGAIYYDIEWMWLRL